MKQRQFTMKIEDGLLAAAKKYAQEHGETVSEVLRGHLVTITGWTDGEGTALAKGDAVLATLRSYSAGDITRAEAMAMIGLQAVDVAGFSRLMNNNGIAWPTPDPTITEDGAQALLEAMEDETLTKLVLSDASALFSLAGIDRLDVLLAPELPIVLTDYVEWQAIRNRSVTAQRIEKWISANQSITVVETETGKERIRKDRQGIADRRKNMGEVTVFEAISNDYIEAGAYLSLSENGKMLYQPGRAFVGGHPIHFVTTFAMLVGLERKGLLESADAILDDIRRVPPTPPEERQLRGHEQGDAPWALTRPRI